MQFHPPIRSGIPIELAGYSTSGEIIGRGATANVYKGICLTTGDTVAIKEIDYSKLGNITIKQRQLLESEILIMRQLSEFKHDNILRLRKDFFVKSPQGYDYQYLILDFCDGGDFHQYLKKKRMRLDEQEAKYFMIQFARGLKFLRFHNINHRDLKPQNLLLQNTNGSLVLKIADFGYAKLFENQDLAATLCGSPLYMAPEIHARQRYSTKADLWSVGIILYQICCGHAPFSAVSLEDLAWKLKSQDIQFSARASINLTPECKDIILRLLQKNPHRRITWEDFFNHRWFGQQIELPQHMIATIDPETEKLLNECLIIADLADTLSGEYGRNGEVLTLYLKFLNDLKQIFRSIPDNSPALTICQQHYFMYLGKARQMAQSAKPQGVPEKLIFAAFMQYSDAGTNAEKNKEFEIALYHYNYVLKYLSKLCVEAIAESDKKHLQTALNELQKRITDVKNQIK